MYWDIVHILVIVFEMHLKIHIFKYLTDLLPQISRLFSRFVLRENRELNRRLQYVYSKPKLLSFVVGNTALFYSCYVPITHYIVFVLSRQVIILNSIVAMIVHCEVGGGGGCARV